MGFYRFSPGCRFIGEKYDGLLLLQELVAVLAKFRFQRLNFVGLLSPSRIDVVGLVVFDSQTIFETCDGSLSLL